MSDKQRALVALKFAEQTCIAALASFSESTPKSDLAASNQAVLRNDLMSLLSLLHASTTKLSLALKPSSPTYSASLTPLKDVSDHVSAISHCVLLFESTHGATFIEELYSVAKNIVESVLSLVQTFLNIEATGSRTSTGQAGDEYMVRIGAVHEIIKKAQSTSGLSRDNIVAVQKKLSQDHESLDDGLKEVGEMIDEQASTDEVMKDDWDDGGWGELGLDSAQRMDVHELERAKKIHAILRLSTLLHKRILKDILSPQRNSPLNLPTHIIQHLDTLPPESSALLVASDDLASTLYTPQDPSDISTELASFLKVIQRLQSTLTPFFKESALVEQMEALSLQGSIVSRNNPEKWFEICFDQIRKAAQSLESTMNRNLENN
ncbi:hypothetical protein Hypma_011600 [Hypsizygus marmoreus]|uniref:Uncharacterized protein n=1 Tax=Hypsizygus marmoreus TaxID=39966 RepID=A0A369JRE4_HYPMA|nr:hypothetical protein Hypma_011600 [Hypsizygus marmoreus]